MVEETLPEVSEREKAELKATELKASLGKEVHLIFFDTDEHGIVIGYLTEPDRITKMRALDLVTMSRFTEASDIVLRTSLIAEESDKRILSEDSKYDKIYLGAIMAAQQLVQFYTDPIKKK